MTHHESSARSPAVRAVVTRMSRLPFDPEGDKTDVAGISDCLEELFVLLGTEDVGEVVASAISDGLITQEQGREFLGVAMWSGKTNGAQLQPTLERWLEHASSSTRIGLALAQGVFPFRDVERMAEVLLRVSKLHPEYSAVCNEIIHRRREQGV